MDSGRSASTMRKAILSLIPIMCIRSTISPRRKARMVRSPFSSALATGRFPTACRQCQAGTTWFVFIVRAPSGGISAIAKPTPIRRATGAPMQAAKAPDQTATRDGSPPLPSGPPPKTNPDTHGGSTAGSISVCIVTSLRLVAIRALRSHIPDEGLSEALWSARFLPLKKARSCNAFRRNMRA